MAGRQSKIGGHNIEFVKPLDARLKCPICKLALRTPFQTECGHRFCETCIKDVINSGSKKCPEDNSVLSNELIFRDAFCNREILELACFCTNKNLGCDWQGPLRVLEEHYNACLFIELECPNEGCQAKFLRRLLQEHLQESCKFKKLACEYCGEEQPQPVMEEHYNKTCPKYPLDCTNGCGEKVPRAEMVKHVTRECVNAEVVCPLGQCDYQGSRAKLHEHLDKKLVEHVTMVADKMGVMETAIDRVETANTDVQQRQEALTGQVTNHREELARFRDDLAALRAGVDGYANRMREVEEVARVAPAAPPAEPRGAEAMDEKDRELAEMKERLARLEEEFRKLQTRDIQALGRGQAAGANQAQGGANETVSEFERRLASLEHQNTLSDVQMADQDVKITMLEATSYDGTFIWKIDNFGRRVQDAVSGKCLSIYSPQFYVGRYGYKVCARVYPNGDGMGKGSHLSLFFVLMRGAYDALLPWPFQQKVTFKLIDQTGDQHIVDSFRPDPNSSSFQRPTSNMNIASGCPLFVPRSVLNSRGYIRDETAFFKITVDTAGVSRY